MDDLPAYRQPILESEDEPTRVFGERLRDLQEQRAANIIDHALFVEIANEIASNLMGAAETMHEWDHQIANNDLGSQYIRREQRERREIDLAVIPQSLRDSVVRIASDPGAREALDNLLANTGRLTERGHRISVYIPQSRRTADGSFNYPGSVQRPKSDRLNELTTVTDNDIETSAAPSSAPLSDAKSPPLSAVVHSPSPSGQTNPRKPSFLKSSNRPRSLSFPDVGCLRTASLFGRLGSRAFLAVSPLVRCLIVSRGRSLLFGISSEALPAWGQQDKTAQSLVRPDHDLVAGS